MELIDGNFQSDGLLLHLMDLQLMEMKWWISVFQSDGSGDGDGDGIQRTYALLILWYDVNIVMD